MRRHTPSRPTIFLMVCAVLFAQLESDAHILGRLCATDQCCSAAVQQCELKSEVIFKFRRPSDEERTTFASDCVAGRA